VHRCRYCSASFRLDERGAVVLAERAPPSGRPVAVIAALAAALLVLGGGVVTWFFAAAPLPEAPRVASPVPVEVTPTSAEVVPVEAPGIAAATFTPHARYTLSTGSLYLLGLVENTGEVRIDAPWVTAVLRDAAGAEVGVDRAKAQGDCLQPGQDAPVKILVMDPPDFADVTFESPAARATWCPTPVEGLRIEASPATLDSLGGWVQKGKVHHEGSVDARFVRVDVLAWSADEELVGAGYTYATPSGVELAAGGSARFEARLHGLGGTPERFELRVSARPIEGR